MIALNLIETWLKSPVDYSAGLLLLKQHCDRTFLISILESGDDSFNRQKLLTELEAIAAGLRAAADQRELQAPDVLHEEKTEAIKLMDERSELKARLRFLAGDGKAQPERKQLAFRILAISSRLDNIYNTKEFYDEHGYLPTGKLEVGDDPVVLKKRQANLRTYVTKYRTLASGATGEKKTGYQAKHKQYTEELAIVDKKLEGFA